MGKTETIKERTVYIYLPTLERKEEWGKIAEGYGMSLSKWITRVVEDSIQSEKERERKTLKEIEEENETLRDQVAKLREKLRQSSIIRENMEREIRIYRAEPFLNPSFSGARKYDKELIDLLRSTKGVDGRPKILSDMDIFDYLGVSPTEEDAVKAISSQLRNLEEFGLVEYAPKGWRWVG